MVELVLEEAKEKMEKSVEAFSNELVNIRTGRANPSMLDRVMVEYYGSPTPLNQVAGISVVEGRQLVIKPYDKNSMKDIEHGILMNVSTTFCQIYNHRFTYCQAIVEERIIAFQTDIVRFMISVAQYTFFIKVADR